MQYVNYINETAFRDIDVHVATRSYKKKIKTKIRDTELILQMQI